MRATFRTKLMAIVGSAALAFVVLFVSSSLIARRVDVELTRIEQRYLPRAEIGPKLSAALDGIARAFQDAVAAQDRDALERTHDLRDAFFAELDGAKQAIDPDEAAQLRAAIDAYYVAGLDVSRRLVAGETGEGIVEAITAMQEKRVRARQTLERTTALERAKLAEAFRASHVAQASAQRVQLVVIVAALAFVLVLSMWLSRGALRSLAELTAGFNRFGAGAFDHVITVTASDELSEVATQANAMAGRLRKLAAERDAAAWIEGAHVALAKEISGELTPQEVADRAARSVARALDVPSAALFLRERDGALHLVGRHGVDASMEKTVAWGEGIVGEAAREDRLTVIADPPSGYFKISSALGEAGARRIVLVPLRHGTEVVGVLELASFGEWPSRSEELLLALRETIAIAVAVARSRTETKELLARAEDLAARLQAGEERLLSTNEELRAQQEELRQTNDELMRQARELEQQRRDLEDKNAELASARRVLESKAQELSTVSAYKSQFLANMSHELRTPLNSMLLLSKLLADNARGNLDPKQVEYAHTIHAAGADLLALINQVLDLAKVEAGKQEIRIADVTLAHVADHVERVFAPLAEKKGLRFAVTRADGLPALVATDEQRVTQILMNLVGNAIKFTDHGSIDLRIEPDAREPDMIAFVVADTGAGIPEEDRERVFAPFEQAHATSHRSHGGTGLGLAIARELATLLGGTLDLESELGKGSTFTLRLPARPRAPSPKPSVEPRGAATPSMTFGDDVTRLAPGDEYVLVIEDDHVLAETLGDAIHGQGLRWAGATTGEIGLAIARRRKPYGIVLDVKLPGVDGWTVMESLRADPELSTVPVHFLSGLDEAARGAAMGAVGWSTKPASRHDLAAIVDSLLRTKASVPSSVLLVAHDDAIAEALTALVSREGLPVRRVKSGTEACDALDRAPVGCVIVDPALPGEDGIALVSRIASRDDAVRPAIVVHASRALTKEEIRELDHAAAIVLREGASEERLTDELRSFVRRIREGLAPSRFSGAARANVEPHLHGRRILVADDDMRTLYALSATLRAKGMEVLVADDGRAALAVLSEDSDVDAVLMDVMMPEMDGYEAMRRIRKDPRFQALPVIALTAKAMKGDRERCVEAGATDYLAKPIDIDRLLRLLGTLVERKVPRAT